MNDARKPRQIDRSSPQWLITYADMATLLLAFFIFLFSMAAVPEARFKAAMGSLRLNLGLRPRRGSVVEPRKPVAGTRRRRREKERFGEPGETKRVSAIAEGPRVIFGRHIGFERGSIEPSRDARRQLRELADNLRGLPNIVEVRGHASVDEFRGTEFADDLDLSLARAAAVVRFLERDAGIKRRRLRALGAGSAAPASLVGEGRDEAADRRAEIVVARELARRARRSGAEEVEGVEGPLPPNEGSGERLPGG